MSQILEEIAEALVDGDEALVRENVQAALDEGIGAQEILDNGLIGGMDEVSQLFKDGDMFVPEVLVAAKAMQAGMEIIKPILLANGVDSKVKIMTVTVLGDLHDIGIKLVGMMLEGAGFEVKNFGVDVAPEKIIEGVKEYKPDILGLSAMLTTTMAGMKDVMDALNEEGLTKDMPVMIGGAPLSPAYAQKIGANYSSDANEAVAVAKKLLNIQK